MKKNTVLLSAITLAALCATPHAVPQASCPDPAARNLLVSSYMDTLLNPSQGEDTDFFIRAGGVPNVLFLIDTSRSMRRLPGNGPWLPGVDVSALPGVPLADPTVGAQQVAAHTSASRIVGCGDDSASQASAEFVKLAAAIAARRFNPPCGRAQDMTLVGAPYRGQDVDPVLDYAAQMSVCPYWDTPAGGKQGYDPDSYDGINQDTKKFFTKTLVFHDTVGAQPLLVPVNFPGTETPNFGHNFGDGWTASTLAPHGTTIDDFCDDQGTDAQGGSTRSEICKTCLKNRGWYYDGIKLTDPEGGGAYPSLWYSGNYLNFFPPKFLVTKKIVKDVMSVQPRVRMGVVGLDASGASINAAENWLDLKPTCQMLDSDSEWASSRGSFNTKVAALTFANATKPLASALFDVGRFYHSPGLPWFGDAWENAAKESSPTDNQLSVCFSCQASTVILITDGAPTPGDGDALPQANVTLATDTSGKYAGNVGTGLGTPASADPCPTCDEFTAPDEYKDRLARVAWYMHNMDLRDNAEATKDCLTNGGKQVLDVYTVGFAASSDAMTILRNAADAGGGLAVEATDPSTLKSGMLGVLQEINTRSTSFSVATVSTLQTTVGRSVIVPRFSPGKTAHWKGHLFRFDLYSEFVNACDPKSDGTGVGDYDCDGSCTSVFLEDKRSSSGAPASFITEDGNGHFVRTEPSKPTCSVAPKCRTIPSKGCGNPGNVEAVPFWDAGTKLASRSWKTRNVWTAVDKDDDGDIEADDEMVRLTTATDDAAIKIKPYLGIGGTATCSALANRLRGKSWTAAADLVDGSKTECAKMFIRYLLGADLFNETDQTGYPPADPESIWDREYKLGDIFHSSPVVVEAPFPADGILCPNGLANQCLQSLWKTETQNGRDAYDGYAKSDEFENRRKLILVGANDGLLHAFNGGQWVPDLNDTYTSGVDESLPPFNGHYERGDASEVWAFMPPDMLSKMPMLMGAEHRLFVDGSAMVRDVWVDGSDNGISVTSSKDQKKQANEFHTVAVVGERRGGTHFFALDVTSATEPGTNPTLLWIYPQPNERETLEFGETYDDFLPGAPPIGPVALKVPDSDRIAGVTPVMSTGVPSPTAYEERWVAFLNGGFDPQYLRGRGVHMVDVWTGKELWDFSYPADPASISDAADPRLALRFPVSAVVGMTPWGTAAKRASGERNGYLFDTATFGDTGGQLWVLRFHAPGELGADGKVTNWFGGRVFQMGGSGACTLCGGQPFFYMTANVPLPSNGAYRVLAGTGDRFNLLDTSGGTCGPDNLRACVLRGCSVTLATAGNLLQTYDLGKAGRGFTHASCSTGSYTGSAPDNGTTTTCSAEGKAHVVITCGSGASAPTTTKNVQVACTQEADGYECTRSVSEAGAKLTSLSTAVSLGNWYVSLLVFEDSGVRAIFSDAAGAKAYDGARLQLSQTGRTTNSATTDLVTIAASATSPTLASATSKGWAIYYDHTETGTTVVEDHTYNVSWMDERTSTGSAVFDDIYWNSVQPTIGQTTRANPGCTVARCTQVDRRIGYHYGANIETGGLPKRLVDPGTGAVTRAIKSTLLVPTQADQPTVFVNQKGQIAVGLTAVNPEKGASNVGMSDAVDPSMDLGWIEVSEPLHACRHPAASQEPVCR